MELWWCLPSFAISSYWNCWKVGELFLSVSMGRPKGVKVWEPSLGFLAARPLPDEPGGVSLFIPDIVGRGTLRVTPATLDLRSASEALRDLAPTNVKENKGCISIVELPVDQKHSKTEVHNQYLKSFFSSFFFSFFPNYIISENLLIENWKVCCIRDISHTHLTHEQVSYVQLKQVYWRILYMQLCVLT